MTDSEFKQLTLARVANLIRRRELSPVELTEAILARIDRLNDRMRAFITVTADHALEQARAAEREIGGGHGGPLQGIPISLKDLYDTKGILTTAGAKVFAQRVPEEDAAVVSKLREAGAVVVGKTNLHEFAFGVTTINPHYGTARNPWDPERIAGGSSGGSAIAVALALGFGSMGSDTGGSIRIPASLCGIVGLKPTYGRVSLRGVIPLAWSLDHSGPMVQTVEDAAILLGIVAGYDPGDPYSQAIPVPHYTDSLTGEIKHLRIGIPKTYFYERVAPEVDAAVRAALKNLERLGCEMVQVDLPSASQQRDIFLQIALPQAYTYHEQYLKAQADLYGSDVRARIEAGASMRSIDYVRAERAQLFMKQECEAIFKMADVIVTPTVPIPPPRIDGLQQPWGADSEIAVDSLTRFTRVFNIVGLPAISIPCGFTPEGLPIGMQICGKAFDESTVLRVAYAYEQETRWFERRPPI
ncbi:MAG: Asp-tRNA(Asn)/Glu-tRNA(Gln) amidotransferase subunit GatA [Acidobacteria bacterium]|nr:MAG: Asp-tRNA(Asn)/Glu-tRNA(Gln) amidotransferase subunit GatA [Acidobacteriota bacterium]